VIKNNSKILFTICILSFYIFSGVIVAQDSQEYTQYPFELLGGSSRCADQRDYPQGNFIITSPSTFEDLWYSTYGNIEKMPFVDFSDYTVLAVYTSSSSGSIHINIEKIIETDISLEVYVNFVKNNFGYMMPTQPSVLIKIKSTDKGIVFITSEKL
jgi:hypothetical protein